MPMVAYLAAGEEGRPTRRPPRSASRPTRRASVRRLPLGKAQGARTRIARMCQRISPKRRPPPPRLFQGNRLRGVAPQRIDIGLDAFASIRAIRVQRTLGSFHWTRRNSRYYEKNQKKDQAQGVQIVLGAIR